VSERLNQPQGPEQQRQQHELEQTAKERLEQLQNKTENAEQDQENRVEAAREQIEKHAEEPAPVAEKEQTAPSRPAAFLDPILNYKQTLKSLQGHLKPAQKRFSQVIHQPTVEKVSEALGKTVMRPSVSLGAVVTAVVVESFFYFTARHYGYVMSGSEVILALLVGGLVGLFLEGVFNGARRRH
jgi:hypothetical protein